jgi:hypothetical protein
VNIVPYAAPRGIDPTPDGHRCAVALSAVRRTPASVEMVWPGRAGEEAPRGCP